MNSRAPFIAVLALCAAAVRAEDNSRRMAFQIESQPLATALNEFARQAHLLVLRRDEDISLGGLLAPRVEGEFAAEEALKQILSKTDLSYEFVNERTVRIEKHSSTLKPVKDATSRDIPSDR